MSDERQNRPTKISRVSCKNRLISPDFVSQDRALEHALSSTILLADFLYIGQQILFMLPW